jgi:hypothetical protein
MVYNKPIMFSGGAYSMESQATQQDLLDDYLGHFRPLIGDKRTGVTFGEIVKGIINAGSLVCQQIAMHSAILSGAKDGAQRVIRLAKGESTKRSQLDATSLINKLCERGVTHLAEAEGDELWLILDPSDLRKPYACEMPDLMEVRDLDGDLVPGYRTVNVIGLMPGRRAILYHHLFSSQEEDFISEPAEVQKALQTTSQALHTLGRWKETTWIMDRGLDDVAVWRTIWEQGERLVCRLSHTERLIEYQDGEGHWVENDIEQARQQLRPLATARTEMVVRRGRQKKEKRQLVTAEIRACPVRLTYETNVRREGSGETIQKPLWLVEVRLLKTNLKPWLLITDWPVTEAESAVRIFCMYRQRWAVEDSFKFVKECLGWEEVQLLDMKGIRTLVALGWVAAGFLYELGVTLEWEEVQLLARLGGWTPRPDRKPGKMVLTRGLRRLLDMLVTEAFLDGYIAEHGALPLRIAALLGRPAPGDL